MAMGISMSTANAAPAPRLDTQVAGELDLLKKVHGWHSHCARGHRHVPDVGKVSCHRHHRHRRHYYNHDYDHHDYHHYRRRHHHHDWHHDNHHDNHHGGHHDNHHDNHHN